MLRLIAVDRHCAASSCVSRLCSTGKPCDGINVRCAGACHTGPASVNVAALRVCLWLCSTLQRTGWRPSLQRSWISWTPVTRACFCRFLTQSLNELSKELCLPEPVLTFLRASRARPLSQAWNCLGTAWPPWSGTSRRRARSRSGTESSYYVVLVPERRQPQRRTRTPLKDIDKRKALLSKDRRLTLALSLMALPTRA